MHGFVVLPEAERDLGEAFSWYEKRQAGIGHEFMAEVGNVFQHLRRSPTIHAIVRGNVRRTYVHRYPYVVYYRVVGSTVIIFGVMHDKRHSREWKKRV